MTKGKFNDDIRERGKTKYFAMLVLIGHLFNHSLCGRPLVWYKIVVPILMKKNDHVFNYEIEGICKMLKICACRL